MSLIDKTMEHRAKLFAAINAEKAQQAEATRIFDEAVKAATDEYKASSEKASEELKALITEEYGEPTEAEVAAVSSPSAESDEMAVNVTVES